MPLPPVAQYRSASHSHVGMVRQVNEDACLDAGDYGLWVVADGMGGHAAGDYVSNLIVDTLRGVQYGDGLDAYVDALRAALIHQHPGARGNPPARGEHHGQHGRRAGGAGSEGTCLWAGDSRLYRLREGKLEPISRDHSYVQELVDSHLLNEAEAKVHPMANIVTRAVGVQDDLELEETRFVVLPGDSFLLCSDGLNKTAEDHELCEVLGHEDPYQVVRSLVHLGLTRGAPDNITAVVVKAS